MADPRLTQVKEECHDLLQGVALEVKEHKEELLAWGYQGGLVAAGGLTLARLSVVGAACAMFLPSRLEGHQQPLELPRLASGQGTRKTASIFMLANLPKRPDHAYLE